MATLRVRASDKSRDEAKVLVHHYDGDLTASLGLSSIECGKNPKTVKVITHGEFSRRPTCSLKRSSMWCRLCAGACKTKIRERKGQSGGVIHKVELHWRNPCAPSSEEQPPEETSRQADCDSKAAWNLARKMHNAEQERFKLR